MILNDSTAKHWHFIYIQLLFIFYYCCIVLIQPEIMKNRVREQMNRYPVFSCNQMVNTDESDLFKDEEIHYKIKQSDQANITSKTKKKNQTIISIYDRIANNNQSDPLYPKRTHTKYQHYSTVTSARNSRHSIDKQKGKNKTITKFAGQFAQSLQNQATGKQIDSFQRMQKISLLKRIIDHYNIKSIQKKYYSNLIKSFGLKIQSFGSTEIAVKKDLHPRINQSSKSKLENTESNEPEEERRAPTQQRCRKINQSTSFTVSKQASKNNIFQGFPKQIPQTTLYKHRHEKLKAQKNNKGFIRKSLQMSQKVIQRPLKMQSSSNCIETKIKKYRDFLFVLNLSNHLYRELEIDRYEKTFKYYVGKGNNRNMIKSLMKKRFWFEEASTIEEAHFVWTQIKAQPIFMRQRTSSKGLEIEQKLLLDHTQETEAQNPNLHTIPEPRGDSKEELTTNTFKTTKIRINNKFSRNKNCAKSYEPENPLMKVCDTSTLKEYAVIQQAIRYKKNTTFCDHLKYIQPVPIQRNLQDQIIHNHLPNNGLLGNKKAMFYNLRQFCKLLNKEISDYVPMTFHIKNGYLDPEYKAMSSVFNERRKNNQANYWIIKPGEFSNRGKGISCTNKLEEIRKRISQCKQISAKNRLKKNNKTAPPSKDATLIVQLYIHNPLLYNYRKFDIRVFMMLTVHNGKIKGYWYQEGYVRTSSFVWTLSQIEDQYIHLTNDAVQKNCEEYGLFEPGNKIGYSELQRYLHTLPSCGRNLDFFGVIYPKMREIAADLIKSTYLNLDPDRKRDNFELFGLDFMIDGNFKPWLIEVNTNPCLEISCPLLERIIPYMIENAFRIAVDPLFPPPSSINQEYKYGIPENAVHYNKFELIFDEDRDGPPLRKLYKNTDMLLLLDDIEEDQQIFEQEGQLMDFNDI